MPGRRTLTAGALAVTTAILVAAIVNPHRLPVPIVVGRHVLTVAPGTTLGEVVRFFGIEPRAGDLLDVEGQVLRRGVRRGRVTVNGSVVAPTTVLEPSDVIRLVHARDRRERLVRDVVPVPEGAIPNPQTHVGAVPGRQIITMGAVSGKVVASEFRPSGEATQPPVVALTFDDGPSPRFTRRIVRTLRRLDAPATFFMIGYLAERYPAEVRLVRDAGFAIGNHSMHHPTGRPFEALPPGLIREEVDEAHAVLAGFGLDAELFRPPGGSWSPETLRIAAEHGERTVLWSVDSEDYTAQKSRHLASRVVRDAGPGSIILLHDGGGNRTLTVRALPRIINGLRRKGLEIVALV